MVGAPGFEPGTSCAQARWVIFLKSFLCNVVFESKRLTKKIGRWHAVRKCSSACAMSPEFSPVVRQNFSRGLKRGGSWWGGISRRSLHPTGDGSLGKIKTEHAEFPMNPRRSPAWVLNDHPQDQFPNLLRCRSSSGLPPDP